MALQRIRYDRPCRLRGFSIIEIILTLIIGLAVIIGGIAWYQNANEGAAEIQRHQVNSVLREGMLDYIYTYQISDKRRQNMEAASAAKFGLPDYVRHFTDPSGLVHSIERGYHYFHRKIGNSVYYLSITTPSEVSLNVASESPLECRETIRNFLSTLHNGDDGVAVNYSEAYNMRGAGFYVLNYCDIERPATLPWLKDGMNYRIVTFTIANSTKFH